jgi:hypothetical protein
MTLTDQLPETSTEAGSPPAVRRTRHRRHRWLIAVVAAGAGLALVVAVPSVRYLFRSHPGARSVSSAVEQYRATTTTNGAGASFEGPRPGVYRATGVGSEHISFPPNSQRDGSVMPITVSALPDGCWRWRIDYNTAHWHEYDLCPRQGTLLLVAQRNSQRWDFGSLTVTNLGRYTCSPPAPIVTKTSRAGQSYEHRCTGTNSAVSGTSVVAGPVIIEGHTTLLVGGHRVSVLEQRRVEHLTGSQRGTVTERWWFDVATGLPLRAARDYHVTSGSPIGDITYTESGWWQLSSLEPTT